MHDRKRRALKESMQCLAVMPQRQRDTGCIMTWCEGKKCICCDLVVYVERCSSNFETVKNGDVAFSPEDMVADILILTMMVMVMAMMVVMMMVMMMKFSCAY